MQDVPRDGEPIGEVVMRGNSVMPGYHGQMQETEEAFRGGWFHSGDLAVWHPDGYVELRDRSQGHHHLRRREHLQHRGRAGAVRARVGAGGCRCGDPGRANGASGPRRSSSSRTGQDASEEDLISFCREHLAKFKCPAAVEFGELPRTSTGKVQKFVLREQEWQGREKAIG